MSMSAISSTVYHLPAQRTIPRVEPKNVADLPAAEQEEIRARRAVSQTRMEESLRRLANAESQRIADAKGHEVHYRSAPNISSLTREEALGQIEFMSELIQSGEADKVPLVAAKGAQTTSNYRQYVYWMQQHVKELEGAGQSTLAQA